MSKDSCVEDGDENSLVAAVVGHDNANKRKTSEPSSVVLVEPVEGEDSCHIKLDRVQDTDEVFIATVQPVSWDKTESGEQS